ncbi:ribosome biogenesis GTP-binding protein YihA/YsxC [Halothermothrix orenii]|uniref:Probable GTP-binding protein EngB n=1 Tax=Halothermothrix orenii (strain H 168 / OCM 544 / DSM 9562) TaxID=373903 RepID=ENGB_HALOH|nr:ribosome biogenesis GTP-binding protein YihA/YsxC [Halothermothrix orenii]B8CY70.1 RecName: Full=Probable GTP-binding protein EngB [Halothermothrix orenii H 168]ACL70239.1 GTP-binding protein HSR1-related [Halothermothrix orenii H 168]
MKIKNPRFVISAYDFDDFPTHNWPEFAFSGRSNVGKSSLINTLVNRRKLARTSSRPGRTQSINFFNIDDRFYLVDLPGYGFANVPRKVKEEWGRLIEGYLNNRPNLAGIVQIVDARHKPTRDDLMMVDWIKASGIPCLIAATKVDKISRGSRKKQEELIKKTLVLEDFDGQFTFFSAKTGEGKKQVGKFILDLVDSFKG